MEESINVVPVSFIVTSRLRDDILSQKIPSGSRITIKEMAERYKVSHIPVREAFQNLNGEKLIELLPYKGARVLVIDKLYVSNLYDINRALECLLVENITEREALAEKLKALRDCNAQLLTLRDDENAGKRYTVLNTQFHQILYSDSGNELAYKQFENFHSVLNRIRNHYVPDYARIQRGRQEHSAMIDAIAAGDTPKLIELVTVHSKNAKNNLLMHLKIKSS
jgi:DNA-binding GntR family transcriptional regulator